MEFKQGGKYGIELSSINSLSSLKEVLKKGKTFDVIPDRVDECRGFSRLPKLEVTEIVKICNDNQIGFFTAIGIRSMYDIGGYAKSKNGYRASYKIRGNFGIQKAFDEVKRAIDQKIRGFILYDEGLLYFLNQRKKESSIPQNVMFKASVHMGISNPFSAKLIHEIGANTINVVPDLSLEMLSEIRQNVSVPLDIFTDTSSDAGGFLRTLEVPDILMKLGPVYLKCGSISQQHQNHMPSSDEIMERIRQTRCVLDTIERECPDYERVNKNELTLGIPSN
jgi:hypothetical protein